jgi:hypothetical protein
LNEATFSQFEEILSAAHRGEIHESDLDRGMALLREADRAAAAHLAPQSEAILAEVGPAMLAEVEAKVAAGDGCVRGIYCATLWGQDQWGDYRRIGPFRLNTPSAALLRLCRAGKSCLKQLVKGRHGTGYDCCPAQHAAERLPAPPFWASDLIWLESGGRIVGGEFEQFDIGGGGETTRSYACLRCLSRASLLGIEFFGVVSPSGISFHDVNVHSAMRMLLATAEGLSPCPPSPVRVECSRDELRPVGN